MPALLRHTAVLALVAVALTGCRTVDRLIEAPREPEPVCFNIGETAEFPPLTLELLTSRPDRLVVVAEVTGPGEARFNTPDQAPAAPKRVDGGPVIVTIHPATIQRVLGGDAIDIGAVATLGGVVGCAEFTSQPAVNLRPGGRYLLWLAPGRFGDGTPDPAHPLVNHAWPIDDAGQVGTPEDGIVQVNRIKAMLDGG